MIAAVQQAFARHPKWAALLAGALSATGFAPLNLWPLALACLTALIILIERAPDRRAAFLRGWLFGGFPWATLGYALHRDEPLLASVDT